MTASARPEPISRLVDRGIARALVSMAVPMLAGTFALNAYNLADTWYVARLETEPLAAMSFTFLVVMFLGFFVRRTPCTSASSSASSSPWHGAVTLAVWTLVPPMFLAGQKARSRRGER